MITKEQRVEWAENPVTVELAEYFASELEEIRAMSITDVYHPFQAERTQEILAGLNGSVDTWETILSYLAGEQTLDEEDEDGDGDAVLE